MGPLELISLIIIATIIWNIIDDESPAANVKWFIGLLPLIVLAIPALPGLGLYALLVEKCGWKKDGPVRSLAVAFIPVFWMFIFYIFKTK